MLLKGQFGFEIGDKIVFVFGLGGLESEQFVFGLLFAGVGSLGAGVGFGVADTAGGAVGAVGGIDAVACAGSVVQRVERRIVRNFTLDGLYQFHRRELKDRIRHDNLGIDPLCNDLTLIVLKQHDPNPRSRDVRHTGTLTDSL